MMRSKGLIIGLVVLVAVAAIVAAIVGNNNKNNGSSNPYGSSTSTSSNNSSSNNSSSSNTPAETNTVKISDMSFSPASIKVKVGQTVTWTNEDSIAHTVTADTASSDAPASDLLSHGQTYSFTFNKAGTYAYHCQVHPNMKATVIVE
jgi:amicyanin